MRAVHLAILFLSNINYIIANDLRGFNDAFHLTLNWGGDTKDPLDVNREGIIVTTAQMERYKCYLPNINRKETNSDEKYEGPTAMELLLHMFYARPSCSFRLESYWTYEVCHGMYVRQYHEDREGKKYYVQEFTLGRWDKMLQEKLLEEERVQEADTKPAPTKRVDGNYLPYIAVVMGNGTLCDLAHNRPRQTTVFYVCSVHAKNEVYSMKETSICTYEIIILTPVICTHPKYKPIDVGETQTNCYPMENSYHQPYNLMRQNAVSTKLRLEAELETVRVEFVPMDGSSSVPQESPVDTSPVESFLSGRNCLNGGTGWWKYEFCYGKSVEQYHIDKDGRKFSINLGRFDRTKHLQWLAKHPHKRPKPIAQRTQLSHFYSDGLFCEKAGQPRQTEVKLKCLEKANPSKVSLYLLEPRYCEYILGVESPLICDILARADENGLVDPLGEEEIHKLMSNLT